MLFLLYNLLFIPAAALFLLYFALSSRRGLLKNLPSELAERFGRYPPELLQRLKGRPVVWFHAASLGEAKALASLIARVREEKPDHALILTSSNSTARGRGVSIPGIEASVLAPLDFYPLTLRAFSTFSPKVLVIAESELWPSLLKAAKTRRVPVVLANARLSKRSFRRLRRAKWAVSWMYRDLDLVGAQTPMDARRLAEMGARADRVIVTGNLKYDGFFSQRPELAPLRERVAKIGWKAQDAVLVAGSTHSGEEEAVLAAFAAIRAASPGAKLLLAPRHLERLPEVLALLRHHRRPFARWSELDKERAPADVLLLDAVGLLPALYGLGRAAFVGGTLAPRGGHNLLEPVRYSVPVVFGPYVDNVLDVAGLLTKAGGAIQVQDSDEFASALVKLFPDAARCRAMGESGRAAAETLRGATERTCQRLKPLL